MRNYAFASILLIIVGALVFTIFIMFNYVLYNSDSGVDTTLDDMATERFSANWLAWYTGVSDNIKTGFQMLGPLLIGVGFILFIASKAHTSEKSSTITSALIVILSFDCHKR